MSDTNTPVVPEIKFRDDLIDVSEKAKAVMRMHLDEATGSCVIPAGVIMGLTDDDVTEEMYEKVHKKIDLISNALTKAGSELGVEVMSKNKDLQQVTVHAPIWKKDSYEGVFKRTGVSRNVKTGEVTAYVGSVGVGRVNVVATRPQSEWAAIKQNMRQLADAAGL